MLSIVLIEPSTPGNIGFIARAMKNFGLKDLILINPKCELKKEAIWYAKHAKDIIKKSKTKPFSYLKKFDYLIGTTAIIGSDYNIPRSPLTPKQLASELSKINLKKTNIALIFGREGSGLNNKEIQMCDFIVTIPTSKKYPTMNISHSASISVFATFISFEIIFFLSAIIFTYIRITKIILFPHLNLFMISSYCVFFLGIVFMYTLNKITIKNNFKNKIVNRIVNILVLFIEGMKSINRKLRLLFVIIVIHIGIFFIQILRLSFAYLAIKTPPTLLKITFINLLNSIAAFIPLTPGNLGIQEFVITFSSQIIGFTKEEGFVAAAIIRIAALSIVVTLGITFSLVLKKGNDY